MREWRVLALEVAEAGVLLEEGLALLDGLAADPVPTVRWYRASEPAVVLGRGQRANKGAVADAAAAGAAMVPRYSGGGAVLLDRDVLALDVLLPTSHPLLDGGVEAVFTPVGRAWAAALRRLGVHDVSVWEGPCTARRQGSDRERLLAALCYATLGRGEVLAGGRKLVGLAQRRRRQGALVQCGLLRRWRPARLLQAFGADPSDPEITGRAVGLDDLLSAPPSDEAVMHAVERELLGR